MFKKVLISVIVLLAIALAVQNPFALVEQREVTRELEKLVGELEAENEALSRKIKEFDDPQNIELLAREKLGLVKEGETAFVVVTSDSAADPGPGIVSNDAEAGSTIDSSATSDSQGQITPDSLAKGHWYDTILEFLGFVSPGRD